MYMAKADKKFKTAATCWNLLNFYIFTVQRKIISLGASKNHLAFHEPKKKTFDAALYTCTIGRSGNIKLFFYFLFF